MLVRHSTWIELTLLLLCGMTPAKRQDAVKTINFTASNGTATIPGEVRTTRSVVQLSHMVQCYTSCQPLSYKRYGCYCGFKGSGQPVDMIDSCCRNHDWCYSRIPCPALMLYVLRYTWVCLKPGLAECSIRQNSLRLVDLCAYRLCECDRMFSRCIGRFACPPRRAVCWSNPLLITLANLLF